MCLVCSANYSLLEQLRSNHIFTENVSLLECKPLVGVEFRGGLLAAVPLYRRAGKHCLCWALGEGNPKLLCPTARCPFSNRRPGRQLADCPGGCARGCLALLGRHLCQGSPGLPRASCRPRQHFYHCTGSFESCYHTQRFALSKPTSACVIFHTNTLS